jgi:hypothetical protein
LDSRVVIGQFLRNSLFLQAFYEGRDRGGIFGKSRLISSAYVLSMMWKTPESNKSLADYADDGHEKAISKDCSIWCVHHLFCLACIGSARSLATRPHSSCCAVRLCQDHHHQGLVVSATSTWRLLIAYPMLPSMLLPRHLSCRAIPCSCAPSQAPGREAAAQP